MTSRALSDNADLPERIKVLHFITELSPGGAQTALCNLLTCLSQKKYDLTVACLYNGDKMMARRISALGIPVFDLKMKNKFRLDAFWRFFRLLSREKPVILQTWMFHANTPGRVLGRAAGVRHIISSERTMGQEGLFRRWLDRITAPLADRILCVSQEVAHFAADVIGLPASKLIVIHNGVDSLRFQTLPTQNQARLRFNLPVNGLIIGAIGRPRPVKGYPILLQAFSRIAAAKPEVYLLFVGDGPDRNILMHQADQNNIKNRVIFLGDQEDIPGMLSALDIIAIPSLYEGMPNVALEAMAAGLPVVGTRVGGIPEVVIDGETGLLTPPSDSSALAEALLRLINDPDLRKRFGETGRRLVCEHFSEQSVCQKMENLYAELLRED